LYASAVPVKPTVATTAPTSIAFLRPTRSLQLPRYGLAERHDQHEEHDRQADDDLRGYARDRDDQLVHVARQVGARELLGEDEREERRAHAVQVHLVAVAALGRGAEAHALGDLVERVLRGLERLAALRGRGAHLVLQLAHQELVAHVEVIDRRIDAPQQAPDLVVGADARGRGEVAGAHAVDLAREFPQARGEARAGHEIQQLEREEERHHEHHHHVEQHPRGARGRRTAASMPTCSTPSGLPASLIGIDTMYCWPTRAAFDRSVVSCAICSTTGFLKWVRAPIGSVPRAKEHVARRCW